MLSKGKAGSTDGTSEAGCRGLQSLSKEQAQHDTLSVFKSRIDFFPLVPLQGNQSRKQVQVDN